MRQFIYNLQSIVWTAYVALLLLIAAVAVAVLIPSSLLAIVLALGSITFGILSLRA